ncbi:hypothetical protein Esti_004205 [Eimeria stiedai]
MEFQGDHRINVDCVPSTARYNASPSIREYTDSSVSSNSLDAFPQAPSSSSTRAEESPGPNSSRPPSHEASHHRDWAYWPPLPEPRGYQQLRPWVWLGRIPKWQQKTARIICCVALLALFIMCLCITIQEVQTERRLEEENRQRQKELKGMREMQALDETSKTQDLHEASTPDSESPAEPLSSANHELPKLDKAVRFPACPASALVKKNTMLFVQSGCTSSSEKTILSLTTLLRAACSGLGFPSLAFRGAATGSNSASS